MPIKVTIIKTLEDWWGAEEALADGGTEAVLELMREDIYAVVEGAAWTITQTTEAGEGEK
jgi:hypothetical protein